MKKEYTSPELELIKFSTEDVIVTSMTQGETVCDMAATAGNSGTKVGI